MFDSNPLEAQLQQLLLLAMEGDEVAYQAFLTGTDVFVKRYLTHLGGQTFSPDLLSDVRQEVMLSIHQKKHTYLPSKPLLPWMYAITRYRYIDFYRSQKRSPQNIPLDDVYLLNANEPFVTLEEIMGLLTPPQQELLRLVKIEEVPYQQAAQKLGLTVAAVKVNVHRMMKSLKQKLNQ